MSAFAYERDEWRSALAGMSENERAAACGHYFVDGHCVYCPETVDP